MDYASPTKRPRKKKSANPFADDQEIVDLLCENIDAEDASLYHQRATWYENVLFTRGVQYARFHTGIGKIVPLPDADSRRVRVVYNVTRPIVESMKAIYLASTPKREVVPMGDDEDIIDAAEFASDLLDWRDQRPGNNVEELCVDLVSHLVEMGNAFVAVLWDPSGGRMLLDDGNTQIFEGEPFLQVVSPLEVSFHPHARSMYDSPYFRRVTIESKEWLETFYPEKLDEIRKYALNSTSPGTSYQNDIANLAATHGRVTVGNSRHINEDFAFWEKMEFFHIPCPKYPKGLYVVAACEGGKPKCVLFAGPNPYGKIPYVHFKMYSGPGMAWGETIIPDLKSPQREINRRHGQLIEWANILANPLMIVPNTIDLDELEDAGNGVGRMVSVPPGSDQAYMLQPTGDPSPIILSMQAAMEKINFIAQPVGPGADETNSNVRSATQLSLMEDLRNRKVAPMLRSYELAWNRVNRMYLSNWSLFQKVPKNIGIRKNGTYRSQAFYDTMRLDQVQVEIVPYSSLPVSRSASLAEAIEMTKVGLIDPINDPETKGEILDSVLRTNSSNKRLYRSIKGDWEKARRNLHKIRRGAVNDVAPDFMDNPTVHRAVYEEWMKTEEYSDWRVQNPQHDQFLRQLVMVFAGMELNNQLAMQAQAGKIQGQGQSGGPSDQGSQGPKGVAAQAQQIAPGNPMGGNATTRTQGYGRAPVPRERGPDGSGE